MLIRSEVVSERLRAAALWDDVRKLCPIVASTLYVVQCAKNAESWALVCDVECSWSFEVRAQ